MAKLEAPETLAAQFAAERAVSRGTQTGRGPCRTGHTGRPFLDCCCGNMDWRNRAAFCRARQPAGRSGLGVWQGVFYPAGPYTVYARSLGAAFWVGAAVSWPFPAFGMAACMEGLYPVPGHDWGPAEKRHSCRQRPDRGRFPLSPAAGCSGKPAAEPSDVGGSGCVSGLCPGGHGGFGQKRRRDAFLAHLGLVRLRWPAERSLT